ncbi:PadR family transcriptional regulator [Amycolatopsis thermophila]|uniref:DNA-binding PadR family transcriptional regulator n=1 Tax=Amycolatopsis thermophila TaxID=206084 RepID=A0ABU0ELK1_9PSEU|nr:PadR family transcriptional regulator [Amycolatopsis thermophila]MDQ0376159.1 DNA-binding PadR family transcriptional regulator [Amycolatopsis thermophila]
MPRRVLENPLVLAVMGLLLESPMHPYQMLAELRERSKNRSVNRGTLYDVVEALVAAEWLAPQGTERDGNRPERTVYALTGAGRHELKRRLDNQIREPRREFTEFLGAVSYVGALGPDGAVDALTERARRLAERIEADQARLDEALDGGVPRLYVIEAEYALHLSRAELGWVRNLVDEIRAGSLAWPS